MSSFDDTNEMKSFVKKAMSIPLLEENHEKVLAKKWIKNKDEKIDKLINFKKFLLIPLL